jgi:hypothetical protein
LAQEPPVRPQPSLNRSLEYSLSATEEGDLSGVTQLLGIGARFNVTGKIDIGLRAKARRSWNAGVTRYCRGPSTDAPPAKEVRRSFRGRSEDRLDAISPRRGAP